MLTHVPFKLDRRNMDKFARDLAEFEPEVSRVASAAALNRTAKGTELLAKRNIQRTMTVRNKFTLGSVRSTRTPPSRATARQFTLAGSIQPYLAAQEKGGTLPRTKQGRRMTTSRGSREGDTAYPRRKIAKGRFRSRNIRIAGKGPKIKGSRGRKAKVQVEMARAAGKRFVFLRLSRRRAGLFAVNKKSIFMVHSIDRRRVRLKPNPWFRDAVKQSKGIAPTVFRLELAKTMRLRRTFQ